MPSSRCSKPGLFAGPGARHGRGSQRSLPRRALRLSHQIQQLVQLRDFHLRAFLHHLAFLLLQAEEGEEEL